MSAVKEIIVNDVYLQLIGNTDRNIILKGSGNSGKSVFGTQKVMMRMVTETPHAFLAVRKNQNKLEGSLFREFKKRANEFGIYDEFTFNTHPLYIRHNPTGNEILFAGMDDPEKLKSITGSKCNISGNIIEEFTELDEEDFDQIDARMRGNTSNYFQTIAMFNPVDERHWVKKRFFPDPYGEWKYRRYPTTIYDKSRDQETTFWTTCVATTIEDNHYATPEDYAILESKAAVSRNFYRIYKLGQWGKAEPKNPWAHNFNYDKHVSDKAVFQPGRRVYFSHDFNVSPMAAVACHIWKDEQGQHIHFFQELSLDPGDAYKMAKKIEETFPAEVIYNAYFTGDATARKRDTVSRGNVHNWAIIQEALKISHQRLQVPRANPTINDNKTLVNLILALHPDIKFHPSMTNTINELQFTEADDDGDIMKANRENPDQRFDFGDCVRYAVNTWLPDYAKLIKK